MAEALYMGTILSDNPSNKDASLEKMVFARIEQYSILKPPASNPASPANYTCKVPRASNFGFLKAMMVSSHRVSLFMFIRLTTSSEINLAQCEESTLSRLGGSENNAQRKIK